RIALAVLVLGRAGRVDQRGVDDGALAQRQATVAQVAIDHRQNPGRQLVALQQATEVEDGGFVGDALEAQPGKLAQDRRLVQRFFHRRVAVAKPVLQQMHTQHGHQRIGRTPTFSLRVVRLDQRDQALPRHHLFHLDQEQLLAGLLALAGVLGVGEGHLLHRKALRVKSADFAKSGSLSQSFPSLANKRIRPAGRPSDGGVMARLTVYEKRTAFREMHRDGCFLLPNPWDLGGARILESLGYKALATTSSGYAWSQARADGQLARSDTLAHLRYLAAATDLPINADFESGFGLGPDEVFESVGLAVDTGVAGLSIEDATGDPRHPLRDRSEAVDRLLAARAAIDAKGGDTLLVGRAENCFVGQPGLDDVIKRLVAYSEAGADCLYAPGIRTREEIRAIVEAVAPKPVNVLIGWTTDLTVADLADMGVRRISVGGALARSAWSGFIAAARMMSEEGRFDGFAGIPTGTELNELFATGKHR